MLASCQRGPAAAAAAAVVAASALAAAAAQNMEPWKPSSFGVSFVLALASLASRAEEHAQARVGAGRVTPPS